jgi:hypothetical protein
VPDGTRLGVSLTIDGIANAASANIGFLMGDVNGNRIVNQTDVTWVRDQVGEPLSNDNFLHDLNTSGVINQADVSLAHDAVGNYLP